MPQPERGERSSVQDPEIWWTAVTDVISQLAEMVPPSSINAIAIDGTSGTLLLTDPGGKVLLPARMYDDAEAVSETDEISRRAPASAAVHSATSGLAKLLRMSRSLNPDTEYLAMHQADWISGRFSGRFGISDINNALKLGYDAVNNRWPHWLQDLKVDTKRLPSILRAGTVIGTIAPGMSKRFGLKPDTLICAGTTDSTASVMAAGAKRTGDAVTVLGSTLVTKVVTAKAVNDPDSGVYSHRYGEQWLVGGASNSGGAVLLNYFSPAEIRSLSSQMNPHIPTGLDYYPLLRAGERFPVNDPNLKPRMEPRPASDVQFLQGLLEGIARIESNAYLRLEALGCPYPSRVITVGGGSQNEQWQQIRSRTLDFPVERAGHQEAAYGVALLAMRGHRLANR